MAPGTGPGIAGPLELFATWAHEVSHAIVGILCGASISRVDLSVNGSGATGVSTSGALGDVVGTAIASAGYVGTAVFGALLLVAGRWVRGSRGALAVIGAFMMVSAVLWMPSAFAFGLSFGVGGLLGALAFVLPDRWVRFLTTALGALTVVEGLIRIADVGDLTTDAVATSRYAGVGIGFVRVVWVLLAMGVALGALVVRTAPMRRAAARDAAVPDRPPPGDVPDRERS